MNPTIPLTGRFAELDGLTQMEQEAQNTRQFIGNGTPYLEVPGLVGVQRVRIDHMELPLEELREYLISGAPGAPRERVVEPVVSLQQREDGSSVLLRSVISNDGKWQEGAKIYITGEWADGDDQTKRRAKAGSN